MKLENRTRYRTEDLRAVLLGALEEAGLDRGGHDRVVVRYSRYGSYNGECYPGKIVRWNGLARMTLRLPKPTRKDGSPRAFDFAQFVWLVRHEVGHWRGLEHAQMAPSMLYWDRGERKRISPDVPVGKDLPLPGWASDLSVALEPEKPKPSVEELRPIADARREEKLSHAREKLAAAERKAKLASTIVKRWTRRLKAAERAISVAAGKGAKP